MMTIQMGTQMIEVEACPLTGKTVEMKITRFQGIVVGRRSGWGGNRRYAYIIKIGNDHYNASRQAFKVL